MLRELSGHSREVWTAAFSPDGKLIVTASKDGTARIWDMNWINVRAEELVHRVCADKLVGAQMFTLYDENDETDPILTGLNGTDPCERRGPFAAKYWIDVRRSILGLPEAPEEKRRKDQ
jgi:WD domain, G-beta repeat